MKLAIAASIAVLGAVFFLIFVPNEISVLPEQGRPPAANYQPAAGAPQAALPPIPEAVKPVSAGGIAVSVIPKNQFNDLEKQAPLPTPPETIKGIYITAWTAGSPLKMNGIINLVKRTELNAVVIDIKDFSGYVSYRTGIPEVAASGAEGEPRILQPNALIKRLHDAGIYVIARQTVFQDPILAVAHPEWALRNASSGKIWADNHGLHWMDPSAKPVWDYNVAIAKDALSRGFDEVNFDYVRHASDGDLTKIAYPFWDKKSSRRAVIRNFFKYLRENLPDAKISADIFGLSTVDDWDDLGIGQVIEDAYGYFDYVCPMVYPSHYAKGFLGYKNPADHPYEVVKYSMDRALERLRSYELRTKNNPGSTATSSDAANSPLVIRGSKLRPWIQDFDLGATYDAAKVGAEIRAVYGAFSASTSTASAEPPPGSYYGGWTLWDPANVYTEKALEKE